jgi:hypothetical protein
VTPRNECGAKYCQLGDDAKGGGDPEDRLREGMREIVDVIQLVFAPMVFDINDRGLTIDCSLT